MLDFLASFSSNKKVFVSDITVAEKVAQMEKVGDGGEEVHATFSWSNFACIDNSWVLCMCQHIMLTEEAGC
jgi:hypothetical protein